MLKKLFPIYLIAFINTVGFGLLIPVMPFVIEQYSGGNEFYYGVFIASYPLLQFFASPVFGALSDKFGRKIVLIISQSGTLLSWIIFGLAYFLDDNLFLGLSIPLWIMFFAHSLDGLTAGNTAVIPAYISDVIKKEHRSKAFSYMGAVRGFGILTGPLIGGLTASSQYGYFSTSVFAVVLSLIGLIAIFKIKEKNASEKKEKIKWSDIYQNLNIIKGFKKYKNHHIMPTFFTAKLLFFLAFAAYTSTIFLYIKSNFNFSQTQLGEYMVMVGIFIIFNQTLVGKKIIEKMGNYKALILGFLSAVMAMFTFFLSSELSIYLIFIGSYFMTLGISLVFPSLGFLSIAQADKKNKGEISGLMESISALAEGIVPLYATALYVFLGQYSFLISLSILLIGILVLLRKQDTCKM